MGLRKDVPKLDLLFHRLALVNARVQEARQPRAELLQERREVMELITRERLGQTQQISWTPGDAFTA